MKRKNIVIVSLAIFFSIVIPLLFFFHTSDLFNSFRYSAGKEKAYGEKVNSARKKHTEDKEYISNFARLTAELYDIGIHELWNMTGPFELLSENEFLLIAKCGEVYLLKVADKSKLLESRQIGHVKNAACVDNFKWGIVKDSQIVGNYLLISYLEKIDDAYGLVMDRVSKHEDGFDFNNPTRVFESIPKVSLKQGIHNHTYGRIAKKNESEVFLVIADFGAKKYIDNDDATLGKLFLVNIHTGTSSLIAKGFRSPGGLYYDQNTDLLWESEHGPVGGDEVNLVKEGNNYGWPHVSYGKHKDKTSLYTLHHNGYEKPKYVFVPSVGTSNIIQYPVDGEVIEWRGDLILGTLRERTLFRLKVEDQAIIYAEPIANIGSRIRDIKIDEAGKIYLKTDNSELIIIRAEPL